jgi:hypothetical protein
MAGEVKTFDDYSGRDYLTIIPSKGRPDRVAKVQKVFPNAVMYINASELESYAPNCDIPIILHNETMGYGSVMNSIFRECTKANIRYSVVFDDDVESFDSLVGNRPRKLTVEQTEEAIVNACQILEDLDAYIYLFSTCSSCVKYQQSEPFKIGFSLSQGAWVLRNDKMGRFKLGMHHYEDFDFCMDYVLKHRYMVIENRFQAVSKGAYEAGGCNSFRTSENEKSSMEYIRKKWKGNVAFVVNQGGTIRPTAKINRQQRRK